MGMNLFYRNCPTCGKELSYTKKAKRDLSVRENRNCYSCAMKIPRMFSDEHKKNLSLSLSGKKKGPCTESRRLKLLGKKQSLRTCSLKSSSQSRRFSDWLERYKESISQSKRFSNPSERHKTSTSVKLAMHRPDVRKRHIEALHHSKWLKVRTDKGQMELIEKWNRLGFKFEPNYQVHTDTDLFYIDGYDKDHNVVLEYDSKYHQKLGQKKRDLVRQQKIINILHPKKFWRYDTAHKNCENVLGGSDGI